jgi:hypothetical protein
VNLYYVVPRETAIEILLDGFWDTVHPFLPHREEEGVWLTSHPLSVNEGWPEEFDTVLEVKLPLTRDELRLWEWTEDSREDVWGWLIPAEVVNAKGQVRLMESALTDAEILESLQMWRHVWEKKGVVGKQLQEQLDRFEAELRRWEPQPEEGE